MIQNIDCLQGATIVTDPLALKGNWTSIECLTNLEGVVLVDGNLTEDSLPWMDSAFLLGQYRPCKFTEVTFTGTAVLYA